MRWTGLQTRLPKLVDQCIKCSSNNNKREKETKITTKLIFGNLVFKFGSNAMVVSGMTELDSGVIKQWQAD